MVKQAKTKEEKQRVFDYLASKGTKPATEYLCYVENEKGEITGAYGLELKLCLEPLQSESPAITLEMMSDALGVSREGKHNSVYVVTKKENVKQILKRRYNAELWSEQVDELKIFL